jgi:hypothetical protein
MLFGTMHLLHNTGGSAVSIYEKHYPNVTFVISELGNFDTNLPTLFDSKFVKWPIPAIASARGTWLGGLDLSHFIPPSNRVDQDCNVHHDFPKVLQKPMEELVDAFLYLAPPDLRLREKIPADIALDASYRAQLQQGGSMLGFSDAASESPKDFDEQIVKTAEDPIFAIPNKRDPKGEELAVQACREFKSHANPPQ